MPVKAIWFGTIILTTGATLPPELLPVILKLKSSKTVASDESVAETRTLIVPTCGEPVKVLVAELKLSHDGKGLPLVKVTL